MTERRRELVDKAREQWVRKLIDPSRRNNLLYFRATKTGTVDLSTAHADKMAALLSGESVAVSKLVGEREGLAEVIRAIARRALGNLEEKGLQTLFVAIGMATWPAEDGGRPPESPVLLVPVTVASQGRAAQSFTLTRAGDVQVNLVLLHFLEQYGVRATAEELIPLLLGDDEGEPFDPQPLYDEVTRRAAAMNGFAIRPFAFLGNFAFQKMAMVKDLREQGDVLAGHDVVAGIAGDTRARIAAGVQERNVDPVELDRVPPDNEFFVLDADSSQQCAVGAILTGQNAVVHGPPGTGKSQTIVNLIASLAAAGKRILFVAEKKAALDVVLRRLRDVGLDHLAIDLHGADVAPKRVMEQVAQTLEKVRMSTPVDATSVHSQVADRRSRLDDHDARMHSKREPAGKSVYDLQGRLLLLERNATANTRWRGDELNRIDPKCAEKIRNLLKEAGAYETLFLRSDLSPWTGAPLTDGTAAQHAVDLVARLVATTLPAFNASVNAVLAECGLRAATTMSDTRAISKLVGDVQDTLAVYSCSLFQEDLQAIALALAAGVNSELAAAWAWLSNSRFRHARSTLLRQRLLGKAPSRQLNQEAASGADQLARWKTRSSGLPCAIAEWDIHAKRFEDFWADFDKLSTVLGRNLNQLAPDQFTQFLKTLTADRNTPFVLPKLNGVERELKELGVSKLILELRDVKPSASKWPTIFDIAWYSSTLDAASEADPEIRGFHGQSHSRFADEFVQLDEERIEIAAARVRRAHAERAIAAMNAHPEQEQIIRAEAMRVRKHMPLRRLFAQASDVLTGVCPCWMASPLSVSQLLDATKRYFDFVVFDEASQVLPEDAVCAVARGEKLVVAGDRNQLPPTTFFAADVDDDLIPQDEEEGAGAQGFESLLDMAASFLPSNYLDWHYRSRDEALIAFSNHYIYRDRLVTFPGPGMRAAVSHVLVNQEPDRDGEEDSCGAEVQKVVELVLEHARKRPDETLGVITMGIKHRDRIQGALDKALQDHPELDEFFDESKTERYFVKNLEAVQGDERDAIIISVGYGKDRAGTLPFRFGPLLPAGGRRRLNVAATRARQRLTLVSSFSHLDMDARRIRAGSGVELLKNYLEYTSTNGKRLGEASLTEVAPNDFEQDVYDALSARGLKLVPQLGASRFRIDLVAAHPQKPGRYVLAIECDGATYHSSYTARDRDRLRQRQLEALGWRFHRIWSTDWFVRKEEEVTRALKAFESALAYADEVDRSGAARNGSNGHNGTNNHHNHEAPDDAPRPNGRGPRPYFLTGQPITAYSTRQLVEIIRWVSSDGLMRTDDELLKDMIETLGYKRRGVRIEAAIRQAIQRAAPNSE